MGFLFLLFFISLLITCISLLLGDDWDDRLCHGAITFIVCFLVSTAIMCIVWGDSYAGYVSMQEKEVTIEQYAQTVRTYASRGVAEFKTGPSTNTEFTDLKYQNYQTQIGQMIKDLRDQIKSYNEELIGKQVMKKSWFWNWCIIAPPKGSVVLRMSDYIQ